MQVMFSNFITVIYRVCTNRESMMLIYADSEFCTEVCLFYEMKPQNTRIIHRRYFKYYHQHMVVEIKYVNSGWLLCVYELLVVFTVNKYQMAGNKMWYQFYWTLSR